MNADYLQVESGLETLRQGITMAQFRGSERRMIKKLISILDAIERRDERWTTRPARSRMANVQVFPALDGGLQASVADIRSRIEECLLL